MPSTGTNPNTDSGGTSDESEATVYTLAEGPPPSPAGSTLARGVVWADILAEIAADEAERNMRDAA